MERVETIDWTEYNVLFILARHPFGTGMYKEFRISEVLQYPDYLLVKTQMDMAPFPLPAGGPGSHTLHTVLIPATDLPVRFQIHGEPTSAGDNEAVPLLAAQLKLPIVWEFGDDTRDYNSALKLYAVDSPVKITFLRRGKRLYAYLVSSRHHSSMPYHYVGSVTVQNNNVKIDLIGIDGSHAFLTAEGSARSEIPLPELRGTVQLDVISGTRRDQYLIGLQQKQFTYRPSKGAFTEIGDCLDGDAGDGVARIQQF